MLFYGVCFQDDNGQEYRLGFEVGSNQYQPSFEMLDTNGQWSPIERGAATGGPKNQTARRLREELPHVIDFPESHTQNELMELIHQTIYNINLAVNENVNYRGAHQ